MTVHVFVIKSRTEFFDFFGAVFSQVKPTSGVAPKQTQPEVIHPYHVRHLTSMRKGVAMFLESLNMRD